MTSLEFREVDVFCTNGLDGNPLAVIHGADELTTEQMQSVANWTNFSETTFLLEATDPTADYRVRIFTPTEELPFAGHPTIGSAHAFLEAGGIPKDNDRVIQECSIGLVPLRNDGNRLGFQAPPLVRGGAAEPEVRTRTLKILGLDESDVFDVVWIDNGPRWIGAHVTNPAVLASLSPSAIDDEEVDIAAFTVGSELAGVDVEVRCFFGLDVREDPVTGSANASIAQYLHENHLQAFPYVAAQGNYMGRNGRAYATTGDDDAIWLSGDATTIVSGRITLPT